MAFPDMAATWRVRELTGFDGLHLDEEKVPQMGDHDCMVKMEAASLNYRDLIIPRNEYPFPMKAGVVPGSDGAGTVLAIGARVSRFAVGDRVCTTLHASHIAGTLSADALQTGLGAGVDGTLRTVAAFEESSLVRMSDNLDFRQASTLPCAGVTAWNALYGLPGQSLRAGDVVLTLGTGGVSMFAVQFAVAAGATVIATTSSKAKEALLRKMGVKHVLNYREDGKWGQKVKDLTPQGRGVDFVVEVGGPATLRQSLTALRRGGLMAVVGFIGGAQAAEGQDVPSLLDAWLSTVTVRGVAVGSRMQFEEMNSAIEACNIQPYIDKRVFSLAQVKDAYQYMWDQKHTGKVVIDCQT